MGDFNTQGSTLAAGDAASPEVFTAFASITNIGELGWDRSSLDTTKLSATNRTSKAGLISYPDLTFEGTYDPTDTQQALLMTRVQVDNQGDLNYQVTLDTSPTNTWALSAWVKSFKVAAVTIDGLLTFTGTLGLNIQSES